MARNQVSRQPVLSDNNALNAALGEIIAIKGRINTRTAELDAMITELRTAAADELKPDNERLARLEHDVEEYCTYHRDDILPAGRKSLDLPNGTVGFRIHPPAIKVSKKGNWKICTVIEAIREKFPRKVASWLRTPPPELNKDVLVTVDPEELAQVGLLIERKETFGYTLNVEEPSAAANITPVPTMLEAAG